jgi:hypothetical protein
MINDFKDNSNKKINKGWWSGSSGIEPGKWVWGHEFKFQCHQKKKKIKVAKQIQDLYKKVSNMDEKLSK